MNVTPLQVVKAVTAFVVGSGAAAITKGVIDNQNFVPQTTTQKVLLVTGRWGIAGAVGAASAKHTETYIDRINETYDKLKKAYAEEQAKKK